MIIFEDSRILKIFILKFSLLEGKCEVDMKFMRSFKTLRTPINFFYTHDGLLHLLFDTGSHKTF